MEFETGNLTCSSDCNCNICEKVHSLVNLDMNQSFNNNFDLSQETYTENNA